MKIIGYQILNEIGETDHLKDRAIERISDIVSCEIDNIFNEDNLDNKTVTNHFIKELETRLSNLETDKRAVGEFVYPYILAKCFIKKDKIKRPLVLVVNENTKGSMFYGTIVKNKLKTIIISNDITDDSISRASQKNNSGLIVKDVLTYKPLDLIYDITPKIEVNNPIVISTLSKDGLSFLNKLKETKIETINDINILNDLIKQCENFLKLNKTANDIEKSTINKYLELLNKKKQEIEINLVNKIKYEKEYISLLKEYQVLFLGGKRIMNKDKKIQDLKIKIDTFLNSFSDILSKVHLNKINEIKLKVIEYLETKKLMEEFNMQW